MGIQGRPEQHHAGEAIRAGATRHSGFPASQYSTTGSVDQIREKAMLQKTENPLRFVQFGDLHITDAGLQNHLDL
jgi:hypothetical protein